MQANFEFQTIPEEVLSGRWAFRAEKETARRSQEVVDDVDLTDLENPLPSTDGPQEQERRRSSGVAGGGVGHARA